MTTAAPQLFHLVSFHQPVQSPNGQGGVIETFSEAFYCRAGFRSLRGGETVIASRLAGKQPVVVTIRYSAAAARVTPEWRMHDDRSGEAYNIRSIVLTDDRRWLELTAERGVAL